jgi:hypothetical protein
VEAGPEGTTLGGVLHTRPLACLPGARGLPPVSPRCRGLGRFCLPTSHHMGCGGLPGWRQPQTPQRTARPAVCPCCLPCRAQGCTAGQGARRHSRVGAHRCRGRQDGAGAGEWRCVVVCGRVPAVAADPLAGQRHYCVWHPPQHCPQRLRPKLSAGCRFQQAPCCPFEGEDPMPLMCLLLCWPPALPLAHGRQLRHQEPHSRLQGVSPGLCGGRQPVNGRHAFQPG